MQRTTVVQQLEHLLWRDEVSLQRNRHNVVLQQPRASGRTSEFREQVFISLVL